jgi:glucokinase
MVNMTLFVGLDIGGTKFLVASADHDGAIRHQILDHTPSDLNEGLILLHQMIDDVTQGEEIFRIGAAIGGPLDWQQGIVSPLHQPQWRDVPLKRIMEDRWGCPFAVDVDTNVAALGEYSTEKNPINRFLYLTLSTGMGGGFLIDGKVYRGSEGFHPEAGHQSIPFHCANPEGVQCECGAPDCLEALISGNGIRRIYGKPAEALGTHEWKEVAYNLGQGLRNLAVLYTPDAIRIGGGVAVGGGDAFIDRAKKVMEDHIKLVPVPEVRLSKLGYETALLGAIHIAIHGLKC